MQVEGTRSLDSANVAQQAVEPRTADPTAARSSRVIAPPSPATSTSGNGAAGLSFGAKGQADPVAKIGARHVLVQWMGAERAPKSVLRSREQARVIAEEVLRRARNKEAFDRLATDFSDEPGAGGRGGGLGRFGRGQMAPAFEEAVFKLEVGQISDIVETPFGFHVIQRTE